MTEAEMRWYQHATKAITVAMAIATSGLPDDDASVVLARDAIGELGGAFTQLRLDHERAATEQSR